jgi:hypothetical protein
MLIDDAYLNAYAESVVVDLYSKSNAAALAEKIATAEDMMRSAALNDYTPESYDALTVSTAPRELKINCARLVLHLLTESDSGRPDTIDKLEAAAKQYLSFLAGGSTNLSAPLVKLDEGGSASIDFVAPPSPFGSDMWNPRNRPVR